MGILDDIFWKALTGPQARFASGSGAARRYARGFSPILGFEDREHPDFAALETFCEAGERFYVDTWSGEAPSGWTIVVDKKMKRMVWTGGLPLGLFTGRRIFTVVPRDGGIVEFTMRVQFSGPLSPLIAKSLGDRQADIDAFAAALKKFAEAS